VVFRVPIWDRALAAVTTAGGRAGEVHDNPGFGRWSECVDDQSVPFRARTRPT
jgi:hypothetical protein